MNNFLDLAKERYSVRKFTDKPIEKDKLEKILEAAKVAPTAKNLQPVKIYVIQSEEALEKINGLTRCIFGAKTVFLIAYDKEKEWHNPLEEGVKSGQEDASIVATHMMMEAADLGIGTCWVNFFPNTETAKAFGLSDNLVPVLLMPAGYADPDCKPSPRHTEYPEWDNMVEWL